MSDENKQEEIEYEQKTKFDYLGILCVVIAIVGGINGLLTTGMSALTIGTFIGGILLSLMFRGIGENRRMLRELFRKTHQISDEENKNK